MNEILASLLDKKFHLIISMLVILQYNTTVINKLRKVDF